MPKQPATDTVTVRLPQGMRDRVVALTGQPFSRIMRYMCTELIKAKETEIAKRREHTGALPESQLKAGDECR